jgi:hypothetical protein
MSLTTTSNNKLIQQLAFKHGFDLISCFNTNIYNPIAKQKNLLPLPNFNHSNNNNNNNGCFAILLGTTKRFWSEIFIPKLRNDLIQQQWLETEHPFDMCVSEKVEEFIQDLFHELHYDLSYDVIHSWDMSRLVAFQALAHCCGLVHLDESFHLCIHPVYGTWIGLRSIIVLDCDGPSTIPTITTITTSTTTSLLCDTIILNEYDRQNAIQAFEIALEETNTNQNHNNIKNHWQKWVAIRDAISIGKEYRYDDVEMEYHYCKSKDKLKEWLVKGG